MGIQGKWWHQQGDCKLHGECRWDCQDYQWIRSQKKRTHTQNITNITELYHLISLFTHRKLTFPRWVSSHCDSAGMVQINDLWEFNPKKKAVINIHIYTPMIPMNKDFKWPEAETKVFHLQTASPKWGNRKETICLAIGSGNGWNNVGIMLESCWNHFLIFLSLQKLQKQGWDFSFLFSMSAEHSLR